VLECYVLVKELRVESPSTLLLKDVHVTVWYLLAGKRIFSSLNSVPRFEVQ